MLDHAQGQEIGIENETGHGHEVEIASETGVTEVEVEKTEDQLDAVAAETENVVEIATEKVVGIENGEVEKGTEKAGIEVENGTEVEIGKEAEIERIGIGVVERRIALAEKRIVAAEEKATQETEREIKVKIAIEVMMRKTGQEKRKEVRAKTEMKQKRTIMLTEVMRKMKTMAMINLRMTLI